MYFNHAVNDPARLKNPEWHEFTAQARKQGKIRFVGMSGHAGNLAECLDYAIDNGQVDVILCAHNFGQDPRFFQRFTRGFDFVARQPELPRIMEKAKSKGVGVVVMKTLMGARLNDMRPYESGGATFSQAAFRWVLSNQNVSALIVSMTSRQMIDEYLGASGARTTAASDLPLLNRYATLNGDSQCRPACNECANACPFGVPIADVMRTRMYARDYGDMRFARLSTRCSRRTLRHVSPAMRSRAPAHVRTASRPTYCSRRHIGCSRRSGAGRRARPFLMVAGAPRVIR